MFRSIIKNFSDALFPNFCVRCGTEGEWWCKECLDKEDFSGVYACPVCSAKSDSRPCALCAKQSFLNGVAAVFKYEDQQPAASLIKNFKYRFAEDIVDVFPTIWKKFLADKDFSLMNGAVLVPVPLHKRRLNERGFNQAFLIACSLRDALLNYEVTTVLDDKLLERYKYTTQQARLNKEDRQAQIVGAFKCVKNIAPEKILLVDDVFTTGATMQECAKVLKQRGAKYVFGLTLARD